MQQYSVEVKREQIEEFENYLYERENAEATVKKYLSDIRTFFRYLKEDLTINKRKILGYKVWLMEAYAVNSVNSMLAALNQFLDFLGCGIFKVKRVKVQKTLFLREEKELNVKEFKKLLKAALEEGKEQLALCMETIVSTGIRVSELQFFTVEEVKKDAVIISNKGKYRKIILPKGIKRKLLQFAKKHEITEGPIFITRNGKPKNRTNIWREMKALKEKTGIDGDKIFPHNLRHLFARLYYEVTKDLAGLGDLLGHSSLNVTRIYTSNTEKIYQQRLNMMNRIKIISNT